MVGVKDPDVSICDPSHSPPGVQDGEEWDERTDVPFLACQIRCQSGRKLRTESLKDCRAGSLFRTDNDGRETMGVGECRGSGPCKTNDPLNRVQVTRKIAE